MGWPFQVKLSKAGPPGGQLTFLQQCDSGAGEAGAEVQVHPCPVAQGTALALEQPQVHVDPSRSEVQSFGNDPVAAVELVAAEACAAQIQRETLPGMTRPGFAVSGLHSANPHRNSLGLHEESVAHRDPAGEGGPGHDYSRSADAERAVDGEAEVASATACIEGGGALLEVFPEGLDAFPGERTDRQYRRLGERGRSEEIAHRGRHRRRAIGAHSIDLGEGYRAAFETQELQDVQMLAGLGHHTVVGGDHQQPEVDGGDAGEHVADEPLVPRHVDEAERASGSEVPVGESEIYAETARLLFRQAIRVHAGECSNEHRLAVIDMSGRGDQHCGGSALFFRVARVSRVELDSTVLGPAADARSMALTPWRPGAPPACKSRERTPGGLPIPAVLCTAASNVHPRRFGHAPAWLVPNAERRGHGGEPARASRLFDTAPRYGQHAHRPQDGNCTECTPKGRGTWPLGNDFQQCSWQGWEREQVRSPTDWARVTDAGGCTGSALRDSCES